MNLFQVTSTTIRGVSSLLYFPSRALSSVPIRASDFPSHRSLVVQKYGRTDDVVLQVREPEEVLPKELGPEQIVVEHLLACVNPSDINMIQGVYGLKPQLPFIAGNEGVVRVKQVGSQVKHLKEGSLAIPIPFTNSWQSYSVQNARDFFTVDNELDLNAASQLRTNPPSAYRMLKDYVQLKPGDCVIQNGANSAVGVYVVQLAKNWGLKTINVIRDRPNKEEVIDELKGLGADVVVTEEEVSKADVMTPIVSQLGKPRLFLNCVGGSNANNCARLMANEAYAVTYGAMSRQPFSPSATSLIFKQHKYVGFWLSLWFEEREHKARSEIQALLDELGAMFKGGILKPKQAEIISFEDRQQALNMFASANKKYLFTMNETMTHKTVGGQ